MGRASEAVARVGEEPDVVTGESAPAARAPAGQASAGWKVLPIVEGLVLLIALVLPWVLQDYLTVFATRVVILALFALSFVLVWGYAGIMSFGQALFFGAAGYGVALMARDLNVTSILLILPAGALSPGLRARTLASVPPDVNTTRRAMAPRPRAMTSRASSTSRRALRPSA